MKVKVDKDREYVVAVLCPRTKMDYNLVYQEVIMSLARVENVVEKEHDRFVFIHDGIFNGTTGLVTEVLNKIIDTTKLLTSKPRIVSYRRLPLDIEMHGHNSSFRWVDDALENQIDLLLILDPGDWPLADYAERHANKAGVTVVRAKEHELASD